MNKEGFIYANDESINYDEERQSAYAKEIAKILGERYSIIGYNSQDWNTKDGCYINPVLYESTSLIGVQIATILKAYLPTCNKKDKIYCHDIINPLQVPVPINNNVGEWQISDKSDCKTTMLFEDEKFLVAVKKEKKAIHIYMYRK